MDIPIRVKNLSKSYGGFKALNSISFEAKSGTIYGLIGPNGAGKTTLIRALVGSLKPTEGQLEVLGFHPVQDRWKLRKRIGYMPQTSALYGDLTARQNIRFFARAHAMESLEEKIEAILEFTELTSRADDLVRTFSGGMQKRVSLACCMVHEPEVLFLDEPTAAVDPHLKLKTWELFERIAKSGKTVFISTHLMDEALRCDQILILRAGEVLAVNTPTTILSRGSTRIRWAKKSGEFGERTCSSSPSEVLKALQELGLDPNIESLDVSADNLEDIVLKLTEDAQ